MSSDLTTEFCRLSDEWESETRCIASPKKIASHPLAKQIALLGEPVIPLILERIKTRPWFWFDMLTKLTRVKTNPVEPSMRGDMQKMTEVWIKWGEDQKALAMEDGDDHGGPFLPDWVCPPGESIRERMEHLFMKPEEVYRPLGLTAERFEKLLIGEEVITSEMAMVLSDLLGSSYGFWMNREKNYRDDKIRLGL